MCRSGRFRQLRRDGWSFRELIDELPVLVWVASPDGRVEWRNAFAEGFSGLSLDTVVADQFASVHPDDEPRSRRSWSLRSRRRAA